jgi:hypothetical protein
LVDPGRWLVSVEDSNGHCHYHHAEAAIRINRHGACAKGLWLMEVTNSEYTGNKS